MSGAAVGTDPLPFIVMGRCGENQLVRGWHEREVDGRSGVAYRATGEDGELVLAPAPGSTRLCVLVSGPVGLAQRPLDGRIIFNKQKFSLPLPIDNWVLRVYPLELRADRPVLQVRFQAPEPMIPDLILGNGDPRKLGIFLSAIWQE